LSPGELGGARLALSEQLAAAQSQTLGEQRIFVRFVRQGEFDALQAALQRGDVRVTLGRYFTEDVITSARAAEIQLALPNVHADPVVGVVRVPSARFVGQPFVGPRLVNPAFEQLGFGTEIEFLTKPSVSSE